MRIKEGRQCQEPGGAQYPQQSCTGYADHFTNVLEKFSMLVSAILFSVMMIMFAWIVYSIFSTVRPVEGWMSLMTLISFGFS